MKSKLLPLILALVLAVTALIIPAIALTASANDTVTYVEHDGTATGGTSMIPQAKAEKATVNGITYTFEGWATKPVVEGKLVADTLYKPGETYDFSDGSILYAVYVNEVADVGPYRLVTDVSALAAGDKIVILATNENYVLSTNQKTNNRGAVTVIKDGNTVTLPGDAQIITLEEGKVDGTFAFNVGTGYLYAASSSANYLKTETELSDNSSWTIKIGADGVATVQARGSSTRNWMRYNSTSELFACYVSGQQDISIYKETSSVSKTYISGSYSGGETSDDGSDNTYTATFVVPDGVGAVPSAEGSSVTLPEANAPEGFTFAGWATNPINEDTTAAPTLYMGEVELEDNTTFYAVYSYSASGAATWTLVTDASALEVGKQIVIVATDYDFALSTTQNDNNRGQAAVVKKDNAITFGADAQIITLEAGMGDGTFAFNVGNGYLCAASSSSNHLKTKAALDDNGSWKITIADGVALIVSKGAYTRNTVRYNATNDPPLFSCYAESNRQKDVSIYALIGAATHYTTAPQVGGCEHEDVKTETVAATCTKPGSVTVTCNGCGQITDGDVTAALGHEFNAGERTKAPTCTEEGVLTYTCTRDECGETKTEVIPVIDHTYSGGVCSECGKVDPDAVDYSGRYYLAGRRKNGSYYYIKGEANGDKYAISEEFEALESTMSSEYIFEIIKVDGGKYIIYCENNGKYLGHTGGSSGEFVDKENALAVSIERLESGVYNIHYSADDGERYLSVNSSEANEYAAWYKSGQIKDLYPASVPEITGASLNIGKDLTMKYYVAGAPEGVTVAMKFTMNNRAVEVTEYKTVNGEYVFAFTGIAPQCMGDNIKAELLIGGEVADYLDEYSVKAYVEGMNKAIEEGKVADADGKLAVLLKDLLIYGAEAQKYQNYKTDGLVTTDAPDANDIVAGEKSVTDADEDDGVRFTAAGVRFDYVNKVFAKFDAASLEGVVVTANGAAVEVVDLGDGNYAVYSEAISALEFAEAVEFVITVNGTEAATLSYSVNNYAAAKQNDAEIGGLVQALYNYGSSADAYKPE